MIAGIDFRSRRSILYIENSASKFRINKMKVIQNCFVSLLVLTFLSITAFSQNSPCQPQDISAAVYNIVPEDRLQTGDFRPLMKTETAFVEKMRDAQNIDITDLTTQVLPPEMMPDPPRITSEMTPLPSQLPDTYFFTGQITKTGSGFLLDVQLKKSSDSSLLDDVKTPFADAAGAEAAGNTTAAAMLAFFASQAQTARSNRETGDHAIDPHIDLIIDKLSLKPNETSPVKIVLTDCDGVRLKHRNVEAFTQYKPGDAPVQETTLTRVTDDNGERNGDIGSKVPAVIVYIAKFKYIDPQGIHRERTDSKTIVISGGEAHLWQMRADITYEMSTLYLSTDVQSGKWSGHRYLLRKKANMAFVFKANDTDPSGEVSVNDPESYNGFGEVYLRDKSIHAQESAEVKTASAILSHTQESTERLQPSFGISPTNNDFQVSLNNVGFVGTQELFAVRAHPYNYVHKTGIEYVVEMGGSCGSTITQQMKSSGVYTCTKFERRIIDDPEGNGVLIKKGSGTKGYELTKFDFEVKRVGPGGKGMIKH